MIDQDFIQQGPTLKNQFKEDSLLQRYLQTNLGQEIYKSIEPSLHQVGQDAGGFLLSWADEAEKNPPQHIAFDPWGQRIDEIKTSSAWKNLEAYSAQQGIVASGYERTYKQFSRAYQMSLLYLFHPSSAFFSCPLAMTDGAARAIELYGDSELKEKAFKNLTSRDPQKFWTSGQWMTEKAGGSDVGLTSTVAKAQKNGHELYGTKWFTSATTSQMAMTLARPEGAEAGSRGLSLFYLELRDKNKQLNKIRIHRLKDKMGTKALPTAELSLEGTPATLVGGEGGGVKKISSLFNITRIYNSVCAIGQMRRALVLLKNYSSKRKVFGKLLSEQPLHQETMSRLMTTFSGCFHLVFYTAELLGLDELSMASPEQSALLRLLTPLSKLYTAKQNVQVCSEVLEGFGGAGYIEDTGLPKLLRDGQVLTIWEGTTNILSLDVLRAIEKEKALEAYLADVKNRLSKKYPPHLSESVGQLQKRLLEIQNYSQKMSKEDLDFSKAGARQFAYQLTETFIGVLLLEFAQKTHNSTDIFILKKWLQTHNSILVSADQSYRTEFSGILEDF